MTATDPNAGSRSWRTNNPGLLGLGVLTAQHGAIGQVLGVAVFQNQQQGRNALFAALGDESYASPERNPKIVALPQLGPGELTDKARHTSHNNQGWLYVYLDGFLWREVEVRGPSEEASNKGVGHSYADVNLSVHMGRDLRPATVEPLRHLLLPHKIAGRKVKVEIAYARVQWSWSRIVNYGGIHPADPRWEKDGPVCLPQRQWPETAQRRAKRFQRVDLSGYEAHWPEQPGSRTQAGRCAVDDLLNRLGNDKFADFLDGHEGQGLPILLLDDPLGWAWDKAYAYQSAWRDMEAYIADLSNPNHSEEKKRQFPFAPWFDSAVLANRYFFAPAPELDAPNISKDQRKELVRAMEERNEWKRQLDLNDIQTALGTKHRKTLREKIKAAKQPLVEFLDDTNPELERLTAVLDDWFALPAEPKGPLMIVHREKTPRYGDHFAVMEELIARLADDEYALDLQLETEPPTSREQYVLQQSDPGRIFLKKLASADGGHPLHSRLFPKQAGENRYAYVETKPVTPEDLDVKKLQDALAIGRRNVKILREFINHFNTLAEKGAQELEAVVRIIAAGLLEMPLEELEITLKELIEGHLAKLGYALASEILIDSRDPISRPLAEHYAKIAGNIKGAKGVKGVKLPIGIYEINGALHVGDTTVGNLHNGTAASSTSWVRDLDPNADLSKIRVRVPAFKLSLAQKLKRSPVINTSVLGGIALLEVWNMAAATNAMIEKWGKSGQTLARAKFGEALGGLAATAAMFRDEFVKRAVAERSALIEASPKITASSEKIARRMEPILNASLRWANGLGVVANAYSTFMSAYQVYVNLTEGDDAAISYLVMGSGFAISTAVAGAKVAVTFKSLSEIAWLGRLVFGPWGWIGLLLILAGTALLIWVFKENTPLEWWLKHGPFSKLDDPNHRVITNEKGKSLLIGPAGSALQLDNQNRITKVISAPHGMFHKTRDGQVVALVDGQAQPIGQMEGPIDPGFIRQFNTPHHEQRFNGHTPGAAPEDQYGWWYEHPQSAAKALADAIFSPKVTLNHRRSVRPDVPDILEIRIDLASFINGKSLLFAELWRTERDGTLKDKPGEDMVRLCTGEGSGPKTVRVEWPIIWSDVNGGIEHICVRVSLDLHGDGSLWLPMPAGETGNAIEEGGPRKDDLECVAHDWVEEHDVLHMHRGKWEMIQTEKRRAALQAEQERYEARRKQEIGNKHD